ncbi:hypothetical protein [Streptomyces syringium]|uniref:hypothetical protein n=1 Tax=Streptomyces syringium TaxID=76729 RepID=UPI0037D60101
MDRKTAAEQLAAAEGAPVLARSASAGERAVGLVSVAAVFAILWAAADRRVPLVVGVPACLTTLAIVAGWNYFHHERPIRRPHSRFESRLGFSAGVLLGLPAGNVLWDTPESTVGIVAPAAAPALALLVYLALRWRA